VNLDQLAADASRELVDAQNRNTVGRLAELKRTRNNRRIERLVAVVAVLVVIGGTGWLSSQGRESSGPVRPAHRSEGFHHVVAAGPDGAVVTSDGELAFVPQDAARFSELAFTADGGELVYQNKDHQIAAIDVGTGATRALGPCPSGFCDIALAPDGQRLASHGRRDGVPGLTITTISSGERTFLATPDVEAFFPAWSPDGDSLAFIGAEGLYTIGADGTGLRLLYQVDEPYHVSGTRLSWSPDGRAIAFMATAPFVDSVGQTAQTTFTVMTIGADGTNPQSLRDLGSCYCIGIAPPTLTWSPEGDLIAATSVVSNRNGSNARVGPTMLLRPDGSIAETVGDYLGSIYSLAWQPPPT
jgi:Tol biopolymer transport system component